MIYHDAFPDGVHSAKPACHDVYNVVKIGMLAVTMLLAEIVTLDRRKMI